MSKDVNIHVKTKALSKSNKTCKMSLRASIKSAIMSSRWAAVLLVASNGLPAALNRLPVLLDLLRLAIAVSSVAGKISQFFSDLKNRCDEAVASCKICEKGLRIFLRR